MLLNRFHLVEVFDSSMDPVKYRLIEPLDYRSSCRTYLSGYGDARCVNHFTHCASPFFCRQTYPPCRCDECSGRLTVDFYALSTKISGFERWVKGGQSDGGWCSGLSRSKTVLTGLKVILGTSTTTVSHPAIAPFHRPGSSSALRLLPSMDFFEMKTAP
jgi:hypothetical protein